MKNKLITAAPLLVVTLALLFSLVGCSSPNTPAATPSQSSVAVPLTTTVSRPTPSQNPTTVPAPSTRLITDLVGNKITIPATVNRIGAVVGPAYDKIAILGGVDKISHLRRGPSSLSSKILSGFE